MSEGIKLCSIHTGFFFTNFMLFANDKVVLQKSCMWQKYPWISEMGWCFLLFFFLLEFAIPQRHGSSSFFLYIWYIWWWKLKLLDKDSFFFNMIWYWRTILGKYLSIAMAAIVRTEATILRWVMKLLRRQKRIPKIQFLQSESFKGHS